jgi:hypothetical protein
MTDTDGAADDATGGDRLSDDDGPGDVAAVMWELEFGLFGEV